MAYVTPTTRADGFKISASVWNQDVVENAKVVKELTDVDPTVIYEPLPTANVTLTANAWNTRRLGNTLRDPNGIIESTDYPNYRFNLNDGTYLCEIFSHSMLHNGSGTQYHRLRDVSNNATLTGLSNGYNKVGSSGSMRQSQLGYTYYEFTLANINPTTVELQTYPTLSSYVFGLADFTTNWDATNGSQNGVYFSLIKLWKVG